MRLRVRVERAYARYGSTRALGARRRLRSRREARGAANPKGERGRRLRGGEWSARGSRRDKIPRESAAGGLRSQAACKAAGRELRHRALAKERDALAKTVYREPEARETRASQR